MSLRNIQDIPIEVFLDNLLPVIDLPDLLALSSTCKFFAVLCSDDTFWKLKLRQDFNYSITDARNKGA
jgi:SCF-associated factor 1